MAKPIKETGIKQRCSCEVGGFMIGAIRLKVDVSETRFHPNRPKFSNYLSLKTL